MVELLEEFERALLSLDRLAAKRLITKAKSRLSSMEIVDQVIVKTLTGIGASWERGEAALAQVYMSGRICEDIVDELLPAGDVQRKIQPLMAIAVLNDYHLLGKRIVYAILRAGGFDILDYGRVTIAEVVRRAQADKIRVLLISTLMLNSALQVRDVVAGLQAAKTGIKVVVGGAPFVIDPGLWHEVNADAMGRSASEAVGIVQTITGGL